MTPEKLNKNLELLRKKITRKPERYDPNTEFAFKFSDTFSKYTRNSWVHVILSLSEMLLIFKWPFPAYILEFSNTRLVKYKSYLTLFIILFLIKIKDFLISFNLPFIPRPPHPSHSPEEPINDLRLKKRLCHR
ncbi:hypothetical protein [Methylobacter svalbardensis]|uniref:hypothetical protein n=1 Tax=Methylobacter svalbardensis TaxID=3080016 RepID=UPI0030EEBC2B